MAPGTPSDEAIRFGEHVLDPRRGGVFRGDRALKLRPKAFDFLKLLVEGNGRLFSKDELLEALWPDSVATEDSLVRVVSTVRQELGDSDGDIIVTVPKRGYRLGVQAEGNRTTVPEVQYAHSGEISIAYQAVGEGPRDLVYIPGWVSHLEYGWEHPRLAEFYTALAAFSRLILFDKRGTGLSDREFGLPSIDQRMDDVRAVMDSAGSARAVLLGMSEGCAMAIAFAARFPDRVRALIIDGGFACREWAADYPWAQTPEQREVFYDAIREGWGGPLGLDDIAPSLEKDADFCAWWATYLRRSASPAAALALARMNASIDVREYLPLIRVPTLVLNRTDDKDVSIEEARYLAASIPDATLIEMEGGDHLIFAGQRDEIIARIRSFVSQLPE